MVDREVGLFEVGMTRKGAVFGATKRLFKLAEVTAKYENNYMHACYQLSTKPRVGHLPYHSLRIRNNTYHMEW